jgi:hypothetical protein
MKRRPKGSAVERANDVGGEKSQANGGLADG